MNKVAFVMSSILTYLGILLLSWTRAVNAVFPKIAYLITKDTDIKPVKDAAGNIRLVNQNRYVIDTCNVTTIAVVCIVVGILLCVIFYKKGCKSEKTA